MDNITFTATRFGNGIQTPSSNDSVKDINVNVNVNDNVNVDIDIDNDNSQCQTVLNNSHYSLSSVKINALPKLIENEKILSLKVATDSIAILISNLRILVFDFQNSTINNENNIYAFEYDYKINQYGLLPLCTIIPNPLKPLKPDLIIIDPLSGNLQYFESIKLSPSLSILQNKLIDKIQIYNAEFLTDIKFFDNDSFIILTSQKRIIHISVKDKFGDLSINSNQIYNNRPIISSILSKSYSIREYENSNRIISMKIFNVSPVLKILLVLESNGKITFLNHLKGSSTFTINNSFDLDSIDSNGDQLNFIDCELSLLNNYLDVLIFNIDEKSFKNYRYQLDINSNNNSIKLLHRNHIPSILDSASNELNTTYFQSKLFSIDKLDAFVIKNDNKIILTRKNLEVRNCWYEVILLNDDLNVFSFVQDNFNESLFYLSCNKGVFTLKINTVGDNLDNVFYLKNHINQFLQFSNSTNALVDYNLKKTDNSFSESEIKIALNDILDDLLENKSKFIITSQIFIEKNLQNRFQCIKNLLNYASLNYNISNDNEMSTKLLNACELISLSAKFYELIANNSLENELKSILKEMHYSSSFETFLQDKTKEIVILIANYCSHVLKNGSNEQIIELSSIMRYLLIDAFVKIDDEIKNSIGSDKFSTIFIDHFQFLIDINSVTQNIYSLQDGLSEIEITDKYNEILLGLSCFLYYTTNEIVEFSKINKNDSTRSSELLLKNKDKWVFIFIILNKQSDIIPLVTKYNDLQSLSSLLESKREMVQNLFEQNEFTDIEYANYITDVDNEFDNYMNIYQYEFAESLFKYYIQNDKINIMMTCFDRYSEYLEKFLSTDINYNKFGWIYDIKMKQFSTASTKLANYLNNSVDENIFDRNLQASIGKLSNLVAFGNNENFKQFNNILTLNSIQSSIFNTLLNLGFSSTNGNEHFLWESDYMVNNNLSYFIEDVKRIWNNIIVNKSVSLTDLINFISLSSFEIKNVDFTSNSNDDHDDDDEDKEIKNKETKQRPNSAIVEFTSKIYIELIELINTFESFENGNNDIIISNSNDEINYKKKRVWMKLLFRRLALRDDLKEVAKKVILYMEEQNTKFNLTGSELLISNDELLSLNIKDENILKELKKENDLINSSKSFLF